MREANFNPAQRLPRTRGDRPKWPKKHYTEAQVAPHTRG